MVPLIHVVRSKRHATSRTRYSPVSIVEKVLHAYILLHVDEMCFGVRSSSCIPRQTGESSGLGTPPTKATTSSCSISTLSNSCRPGDSVCRGMDGLCASVVASRHDRMSGSKIQGASERGARRILYGNTIDISQGYPPTQPPTGSSARRQRRRLHHPLCAGRPQHAVR